MSIQSGIQAVLLGITAITDLTENIFVNSIPQQRQLPCIVIRKTGGDNNNTLDGGDMDDMRSAFIDLECIATDEGTAIDLAETVLEQICDYTGAADDQTILATIHQDEDDDVEATDNGADRQYHTETISFLFQYWRT